MDDKRNSRVLVSEFYRYGMKKPIRKYAVYGGIYPPAFFPWEANKPNIPNDIKDKVYKVKSSKGDKSYEVRMNASGSFECTCPGYGFRRRCRHIDYVKKELLQHA
jgi:hypothetical protein